MVVKHSQCQSEPENASLISFQYTPKSPSSILGVNPVTVCNIHARRGTRSLQNISIEYNRQSHIPEATLCGFPGLHAQSRSFHFWVTTFKLRQIHNDIGIKVCDSKKTSSGELRNSTDQSPSPPPPPQTDANSFFGCFLGGANVDRNKNSFIITQTSVIFIRVKERTIRDLTKQSCFLH